MPKTKPDNSNINWQPSASPELIKLRATTLKLIRNYFEQREVLEVDTPILSASTVPDPFIESFQTRYIPLTQKMSTDHYYLHTSPEFPMKRLLAAGSGSIYQISKVFRQGESGQRHNPEFTLLEWYRDGWNHHQLMAEIDELLSLLLRPHLKLAETCFISYKAAFEQKLGINPHCASHQELVDCSKKLGLDQVLDKDEHRDRYLDLLFSHAIEPGLGKTSDKNKPCVCFLYHYPASQASLARTKEENGYLVAERFELFVNGMELGNGFHELNDANEQRRRFEADNQMRHTMALGEIPLDEHFLEAVEFLPDCSGVAIGIERLLMVMSQSEHINQVINFPFEQA